MIRPLLAAVALLAAAAAPAQAFEVQAYDGSNPFRCELQQVGTGVDFPDPEADPFCVEYDKTHQNVTEFGVVAFLANEPARVAAANDKCFYYQHDHWRGSVEQSHEQSETYNWDGGYFFDKARGVGGVYVENFTVNNVSGDPTGLPGFPDPWRPFFGYGRGGLQMVDSIPVDRRCVEKADREAVYARPGEQEVAPTRARSRRARLVLRMDFHRRLRSRRCRRSSARARLVGHDTRDVRRVDFAVGKRRVRRDSTQPFTARIRRRQVARQLTATARLRDDRVVRRRARVPGCRR